MLGIKTKQDIERYFDVLYNKIHDPLFKGGAFIDSRDISTAANITNGAILNRLFRGSFLFEPCGLEMPDSSKFFDVFELKTQQLFTAGIIDFYVEHDKKYLDPNFYKKRKLLTKEYLEEIYPKLFNRGPGVLTLKHVEAGFVIWIVFLVLSLIVFLIELFLKSKEINVK